MTIAEMQVYTTIFLAEKLWEDLEKSRESLAREKQGLVDLDDSPRECIVTLESRNWFQEDADLEPGS